MDFNPTIIRIFRVLRLARLLKLSRRAKWIQHLATTISAALPSLMHVSFLLMLFFFMYAVLGVQVTNSALRNLYVALRSETTYLHAVLVHTQLFFNVKHGEVLTRHADFSRFSAALYTPFPHIFRGELESTHA